MVKTATGTSTGREDALLAVYLSDADKAAIGRLTAGQNLYLQYPGGTAQGTVDEWRSQAAEGLADFQPQQAEPAKIERPKARRKGRR
jgi:predicted secreted protein